MTVLTQQFAEFLPWMLALAGAAAVIYERVIGRGVWRNVAEGRGEQIDDLEKRLAFLEAKVHVLESDMASDIATLVIEGIKEPS